jgi:hypothetical protein
VPDDPTRARAQRRRLLLAAAVLVGVVVVVVAGASRLDRGQPDDATGEPPVLAGRQLWGSCAGGFYARLDDAVVLTSSAHCATEGTEAWDPAGPTLRGVFGPGALIDPCEHEGHTCRQSDMNYLVVAPDQIPWGRLDTVDMGEGGVRKIPAGTTPLACGDIAVGDTVEINGREIYRAGTVAESGEYLHEPAADGDYFPCMVAAADVEVGSGDSGGAVLVDGRPAGVSSRSFGGMLGFTPLAEGLEALGLELCTSPDCGLTPPS